MQKCIEWVTDTKKHKNRTQRETERKHYYTGETATAVCRVKADEVRCQDPLMSIWAVTQDISIMLGLDPTY